MSLWTFLDMNSYFAACEQQDRPELRGRPIGIAPVMAETTSFIAASYEAKRYGVGTGTKVADARLLCPSIQVIEARPRLYRQVHERIKEAVEMIAPIDEVLSVDEMRIRPWANETTLADALKLGQRLQDAIRYHVGDWMSASIGLAPNPLLAKVASDFQKPRGLSVITMDDIPHKLCSLQLNDWPGISKGMVRRFEKHGVTTTAGMYRLTLPEMRQVWGGINGERWWHRIRGHDVWLPPVTRRQVGQSSVLAPHLRTNGAAREVACRLVEKAAERLRAEGFHAGRLYVAVASYDGDGWSAQTTFAATTRTFTILQVLDRLWRAKPLRPAGVEIALTHLLPDDQVTPDLLTDGKRHRLDETVDGINRRYGRGSLTVATALRSKTYLDHDRIPFGKPGELR